MPYRLAYKNRFVASLIQAIEDEDCASNPFIFPDEDTPVLIPFVLSQTEFTKIFSCMMTGADIEFPEQSHQIMWSFLRNVECMVDICQLVADCIENSEAVKQALQNNYQSNKAGIGTGTPTRQPAVTSENMLPDGYICDDAHLCGMSRAIVKSLDDAVRQFLENLEVATNIAELTALLIDNSEVTSYAGSAVELAAWVQDTMSEKYLAAYSLAVEDELTCALFGRMCQACEVSVNGLKSGYEDAFVGIFSALTLPSLDDFVNWLINLNFDTATNVSIVAACHYMVLNFLEFGSNFSGLTSGFRTLKAIVKASEDETDTYCGTACECSDLWCNYTDYRVSMGDYAILTGNQSASGLSGTYQAVPQFYQAGAKAIIAPSVITSVVATFNKEDGNIVAADNSATIFLYDQFGVLIDSETTYPITTGQIAIVGSYADVADIRVVVRAKGGTGGYVDIIDITVQGEGTYPFTGGTVC